MELFGKTARVLIEVELEAGERLQFPIDAQYTRGWVPTPRDAPLRALGGGYGELRIPFRSGWMARVLETLDEYSFRTGRD